MANYVKFVKGTHAKYTAGASTYSSNGSIFFAAEEGAARGTIYANGVAYGVNSEELAALNAAIDEKIYDVSTVSYTATNASITFTKRSKTGGVEDTIVVTLNAADNTTGAEKAGLMTAAQKTALEGVISDVEDLTDVVASNKIKQTSNKSDGKTIIVTPGTVTENGSTKTITETNIDVNLGDTLIQDSTSGEIDVNIDGSTIIKNASTGVLSVASTALTQYVGDENTVSISAVDSNNQKTVSSLLTISKVTSNLDANVKEEYHLVGSDGVKIGDAVKIYKDSALLSIALLHADLTANPAVKPTYNEANDTWTDIANPTADQQALCYAYKNVNGQVLIEAVPVGAFINEQEFAKGIQWNASTGKVEGVVDGTSEAFLTVGANGFKLAGVQTAIDTAAAAAKTAIDTTVTGESASHLTITKDSTAADGHDAYSFALADVASEDALEAEVTRAEDIEGKIAIASGLDITKSAGNPTTVTYSPESGANYGSTATNIKDRIAALDAQIKTNADAIDTLGGDSIETIEVNGVSAQADASNKASVTIDGSEIQIDKAKTSANHALINTGGNIYDDATLKAAITALEAQLLWYQAD